MNIELFIKTFEIPVFGMLGVFAVILIIYLCIKLISYIFDN